MTCSHPYGPKTVNARCSLMADDNNRVHLETDEARAGSTPGMTRYILAASLVLIVVAFAAILLS